MTQKKSFFRNAFERVMEARERRAARYLQDNFPEIYASIPVREKSNRL